MDRLHELENLRRSIAMLEPRAMAVRREDAMQLLAELQDVRRRLDKLRRGLAELLEEQG